MFNNINSIFPQVFQNRQYLMTTTEFLDKDQKVIPGSQSTTNQILDKFSATRPVLDILANNTSLARLMGKKTPVEAADSFKFFVSFDQDNVMEYLKQNNANDVKSLVQNMSAYFLTYMTTTGSSTVSVDGKDTVYKNTVAMGNPLAASIASHESGNPVAEELIAFIQTFNALINNPDNTRQGGPLAHLASSQPLIIQELNNLSKQVENMNQIRNSSITLAQSQQSAQKDMAKPTFSEGGK